MQKFVAVAIGSVVALVGFAGAANASATIDLIWDASGTPTAGTDLDVSSNITLQVILTAGPGGSLGGGVSVNYTAAVPVLSVISFANTAGPPFGLSLGSTVDTGLRVENIGSAAFPDAGLGIGLAPGASALLGTLTFHKDALASTYVIQSDANGPVDDILDSNGAVISESTTFNSAILHYLVTPTPTPTPTATPTATPTPTPICLPEGASCGSNGDCCSNLCSGPGGNKVCEPEPTPTATPTATPSTTPSAMPTATPTTTPTVTPTPTPTATPFSDTDSDGIPDGIDNCPFIPNNLQINSDSLPAGDACQCGDVDGDGSLTLADVTRAQENLLGEPDETFDATRCNVIGPSDGGASDCDIADIFIMQRFLTGNPVSVENACDAYSPPP